MIGLAEQPEAGDPRGRSLSAAVDEARRRADADGRLTFAVVRAIAGRHELHRAELRSFLAALLSAGLKPDQAGPELERRATQGPPSEAPPPVRQSRTTVATRTPATLPTILERLHDHRVLSSAEEQQLGRDIDRGRLARQMLAEHPELDELARRRAQAIIRAAKQAEETLLLCNVRLAGSVARRYVAETTGQLDYDDLLSEGLLGLVRAIQLWDHTRELRFSTYATWWVRQSIQRAVDNQGTTVRIPVHARDDLRRLRRASRVLKADGRPPSIAALAETSGLPAATVRYLLPHLQRTASLDRPIGEGAAPLGEFLADPSNIDPAEATEQLVLTIDVRTALGTLSDRQRFVIEHRFGLNDSPAMTLEEIGQLLHVTRERIRQIESRSKNQLAWHLSRMGYRPEPKRVDDHDEENE